MSLNHHETLGLTPDAPAEEIKRAYRRLAMRWHPDRNSAADAAERFRAIRAAYEALTTPTSETREEAATPSTGETEPEPEVARAPDIRLNLALTLEAAAFGARQTITVVRGKACPTCAGSGEAGISRTRFCDACHGSGRVRNGRQGLTACSACNGKGLFSERICPDCQGSGRETASVNLEIAIPPGMLPGDELRLAGQGEPGDATRQNGDLFLTVVLADHPLFRLEGRHLHYAMPVSALAMIAGGEVRIRTLDAWESVSLEAGAPEPRIVTLPGKGYPGRGTYAAGDLIVELQPVFPQRIGKRLRKQLLEVDAELAEDLGAAYPEIAAWTQTFGSGKKRRKSSSA